MKNCLDEGLLQGYLDGELSPALMNDTAAHLAACQACARALDEAEGEWSMFSSVFAADAALPVPSERLRQRLDTALAELQSQHARAPRESLLARLSDSFAAWLSAFNASFNPARAAGFAAVAALVIVGAIFFAARQRETRPVEVARNVENESQNVRQDATTGSDSTSIDRATADQAIADHNAASQDLNSQAVTSSERNTSAAIVRRAPQGARILSAGLKQTARAPLPLGAETARGRTLGGRTTDEQIDPKHLMIPGEENYTVTIASLNRVIETGGDAILRPSLRVDFERNVAVLDQAIDQARRKAIRNPQDREVKDLLFSAYQSKVELLSAVADQAQVAALGR